MESEVIRTMCLHFPLMHMVSWPANYRLGGYRSSTTPLAWKFIYYRWFASTEFWYCESRWHGCFYICRCRHCSNNYWWCYNCFSCGMFCWWLWIVLCRLCCFWNLVFCVWMSRWIIIVLFVFGWWPWFCRQVGFCRFWMSKSISVVLFSFGWWPWFWRQAGFYTFWLRRLNWITCIRWVVWCFDVGLCVLMSFLGSLTSKPDRVVQWYGQWSSCSFDRQPEWRILLQFITKFRFVKFVFKTCK